MSHNRILRTSRRGARTLLVAPIVVLTALALLTGCGSSGSGSLGAGPSGSPRASATKPTGTPTTTATGTGSPTGSTTGSSSGPAQSTATTQPSRVGSHTFEIWLVRAGKLVVTKRSGPVTVTPARQAFTALIAGPTAAEKDIGMQTAIDPSTKPDVSLHNGIATVDLPASPYWETLVPGATELRSAQVVYTLTQFPTISKVQFKPEENGQSGVWPLGRADFAKLLPPIIVSSPGIGQRVSNPVTVSGTADVFEATVSMRILDLNGQEIATRFTTATCGSGCRGSFSLALPYRVAREQNGLIEIYEVSPKDGSRNAVVRIPVILTP
jgi:hypothetical protein